MGLGLPGASLPCAAQVYFPSTITFSGSNVPQQQLLAFTGLKPGRVTKAQMQAASDRLTRSGVFIQANYELDDDALRYTLTLSAALLPVRYDNFPWWDTKTLTALVAAKVPLFGGELYPGGPMRQQVAAALTQLVAEKGVRAKVGTSPVGDAHGKMMATRFHIDAPPVVISSLTINGAGEAFAADIEPIEKAASGHDLAQEAPDALAAAIRAVYTRRGYLDVAMTEPVWGAPVVEDGKIMAPLTVTISSEGEPYTVSAVNFAGDAATTPEAFKAEAKIHVGEVADSDAVAVTGDLLKAPWKAKGYEGVGVDRGEAVNRAQHTVAYTFTVDPGTVYRMGTLTLIGLNKRQAGQVLRYWRMPKGAPFQPSLLAAWRGAYMRSRGDQLIVAEGLEHMVPAYESQADHDMQTVNVVVRFTPPVVVANPLDFHPNWK
jgi:outer membrane protein assembly factor BamA